MLRVLPDTEASHRDTACPRLGFLGLGWIGRHRMRALAESGLAHIVALADPIVENLREAGDLAPHARQGTDLESLFDEDIDGVVIATPSALHASQAMRALERGWAVFCQKPLGRNAAETREIIEAARTADRLLDVDLCYRYVNGVSDMRELVLREELGRLYAVDLQFHNAFGPDKSWFYDRRLSGGGCVMDLGIHLVDLALWITEASSASVTQSRLIAQGEPYWGEDPVLVEDYATAELELAGGIAARLSCSWNLHAGQDCSIEASFYGTAGGVSLRNVNGSFHDFTVTRFSGTSSRLLAAPPDAWGGRALLDWVRRLRDGHRFDARNEHLARLAETLDAIYAGHRPVQTFQD